LSYEFSLRQIPFERQKPLHVNYKRTQLDCGYRPDFLVAGVVVVEVKAIEALLPIHQAQLLSYLKLGGWKLGLLINFHVPLLREGIKRVVLGLDRDPPQSTSTPSGT
jgi:GxxExxY protein